MNQQLLSFISELANDLDLSIEIHEPAESEKIPLGLEEIYGTSNGLQLPFVEIQPIAQIDEETVSGWYRIGFEGYFSLVLFSKYPHEKPFTLWDHESGIKPEGCYGCITELLRDMYEDYLTKDHDVSLYVESVPSSIKSLEIVLIIKQLCTTSNRELLKIVKNPPFTLKTNSLSKAIETKSKLKTLKIISRIDLIFEQSDW